MALSPLFINECSFSESADSVAILQDRAKAPLWHRASSGGNRSWFRNAVGNGRCSGVGRGRGKRGAVETLDRLAVKVEAAFVFRPEFESGAKEQAIDIGDDGGTARGDAALGEKIVERGEIFVDALDGLEVIGLADEFGEKAEVVLGLALGTSVVKAEGAGGIGGELAAAALEGAVLAAGRFVGGIGDDAGFGGVHDVCLWLIP